MIVLLGAVHGFGHSCFFVPCVSTVSRHFDRWRSLALGLSFSGCSFGAFIGPPIISAAAERYAAPGMLIILAGMTLQCLVTGVLLFQPEEEIQKETEVRFLFIHSI